MRKLWIRSLALSLGLTTAGVRAQEGVALGRPQAIATSRPATAAPAPAVTLCKPVPIASAAKADANVQQVVFTPARDPRKPVARGTAPEPAPHKPMPVGPDATGLPAPGMHSWRTAEGVVASTVSRNGGVPTAAPPPPRPGAETLLVPPTPVPAAPAPMAPAPAPGGSGVTPAPVVPPLPGSVAGPALNLPPESNLAPMPGAVVPVPQPIASGGSPCCPPACNPPASGPSTCGPCCGLGAGAWGCSGAGGGPQLIVGTEFLLWWMKGDQTPPLVTTAAPNVPQGTFLGVPGTTVAWGGQRLGDNGRPGGRLNLVYWFSENHCWGLDASAFFLGNADDGQFSISGNGVDGPRIGRPFFDFAQTVPNPLIPGGVPGIANPNFQGANAELVAGPTSPTSQGFSGGVVVSRESNLWGVDANLRGSLWCGPRLRADFLVGGRILGLDERLAITENLTVLGVASPNFINPANQLLPGSRISINDTFTTQNRFYGGQVGIASESRFGNFTLGVTGKLGLGITEQLVQINGSTTQTLPNGLSRSGTGGLLALANTNIGTNSRKMFGVVPEVGATIGYDVFDWWRVYAGYNFLYWNSVARPGEQVNLNVNRNFQPFAPAVANPGPRQPAFLFNSTDVYVHGVSFGMEFRY